MNKEIICGVCGTKQTCTEFKEAIIYFPNRMIYSHGDQFKPNNFTHSPVKCINCEKDCDMVLFGEQYISSLWNMKVDLLPDVLESNKLWSENKLNKIAI